MNKPKVKIEPYRWEEDTIREDGRYDGQIWQGEHRICVVKALDFYMIEFIVNAMNAKGPIE